jgi:hypothetical protein
MSEKLDQKVIDLLDKAGENAFNVMVEQMNTNPEAIEALYSDGKVFCQWVDSRIDFTDLPDACKESVKDGKCTVCQRSPQLDLGMKPADLIRNIKV